MNISRQTIITLFVLALVFAFCDTSLADKESDRRQEARERARRLSRDIDSTKRTINSVRDSIGRAESQIEKVKKEAAPLRKKLADKRAISEAARKDSTRAQQQVPAAVKVASALKAHLYEELEQKPQLKPAATKKQNAEAHLERATEVVLNALKRDLRYTKVLLDRDELKKDLESRRSQGAGPSELTPLAQELLAIETKIKTLEEQALDRDTGYIEAKARADEAREAYLKVRGDHEKSVLENPKLVSAQKKQVSAVDNAKDARMKSAEAASAYSAVRKQAAKVDAYYKSRVRELSQLQSRKRYLEGRLSRLERDYRQALRDSR